MVYPSQMKVSTRMQAKPFFSELANGQQIQIVTQWQSGSWMHGRTACGLSVKQPIGASSWTVIG